MPTKDIYGRHMGINSGGIYVTSIPSISTSPVI